MNTGTRTQKYAIILSFAIILTSCGKSPVDDNKTVDSKESNNTNIEAIAIVEDGNDIDLELENGANLYIKSGGIESGTEVSFKILSTLDWENPFLEDISIGQIYEIEARNWNSKLEAVITLPIDDEVQFEDYQLAYFENDKWITFPSIVDDDKMTISGKLDHFSFITWIRRLFNKPPQVDVLIAPTIYSGINLEKLILVDLENLETYIRAIDPEGKPINVYVSFGFDLFFGDIAYDMLTFREEAGNHVKLELELLDISSFTDIMVKPAISTLGTQFKEFSAPPASSTTITTNWYKLNEITPGQYFLVYDISSFLNSIEIESPLVRIHVYVRVEDDINDSPVEKHIVIPVLSRNVPKPFTLKKPQSLAICPPQPEFSWGFGGVETESWQFRLVKGNNLESKRNIAIEWVCSFDDMENPCSNNGPSGFFDNTWKPLKPLANGVYRWRITSSNDSKEHDFDGPEFATSNTIQFVVDSSLDGDDCISQFESDDEILEEESEICEPNQLQGCVNVIVRDYLGNEINKAKATLLSTVDPSQNLWRGLTNEKGMASFTLSPGESYFLWISRIPNHSSWTGAACPFVGEANKTFVFDVSLVNSEGGTVSCLMYPPIEDIIVIEDTSETEKDESEETIENDESEIQEPSLEEKPDTSSDITKYYVVYECVDFYSHGLGYGPRTENPKETDLWWDKFFESDIGCGEIIQTTHTISSLEPGEPKEIVVSSARGESTYYINQQNLYSFGDDLLPSFLEPINGPTIKIPNAKEWFNDGGRLETYKNDWELNFVGYETIPFAGRLVRTRKYQGKEDWYSIQIQPYDIDEEIHEEREYTYYYDSLSGIQILRETVGIYVSCDDCNPQLIGETAFRSINKLVDTNLPLAWVDSPNEPALPDTIGKALVTIIDAPAEWNDSSCYNNYDADYCYVVYDIVAISEMSCSEIQETGLGEAPHEVDGKLIRYLDINFEQLQKFGTNDVAFYEDEVREKCPGLLP